MPITYETINENVEALILEDDTDRDFDAQIKVMRRSDGQVVIECPAGLSEVERWFLIEKPEDVASIALFLVGGTKEV